MPLQPEPPETPSTNGASASGLLDQPPQVVNVGLELFADELASAGATVTHVEWGPAAGGDAGLADLLAKLGA
ncbi:MAG: hypothetical protein R3C97_10505 [Geminicoccaceae bacterium]